MGDPGTEAFRKRALWMRTGIRSGAAGADTDRKAVSMQEIKILRRNH